MKTLLLVRHAKSSWNDANVSDMDRPLKRSGIKDALEVSGKLKALKCVPDILITSPAVRAMTTALIFARTLNYHYNRIVINEMVYDFSKDTLLPLLRNLDDKYDVVMLVGHDPAFTYLLNDLTGKAFEKMPTASVAKINFGVKHWQKITPGKGKLLFLESPMKKKKTTEE
jgi:phosphohistidine phosphatase